MIICVCRWYNVLFYNVLFSCKK